MGVLKIYSRLTPSAVMDQAGHHSGRGSHGQTQCPKGIRGQYRLRVRYRLMVLECATVHGPTGAARRYGVCVRTVRRWRGRWRAEGLAGLVPRYPRRRASRLRPEVIEHIRHAREELHDGAARTRLWLLRVHQVRLAMRTIQRVFGDLGLPYLRRTRKRAPRQLTRFEKAEPGESVQVDGKFVKIAGQWAFQYTALDETARASACSGCTAASTTAPAWRS